MKSKLAILSIITVFILCLIAAGCIKQVNTEVPKNLTCTKGHDEVGYGIDGDAKSAVFVCDEYAPKSEVPQ